ncbi:hypothetical protein [Gracilibacillus phocaeensis]|uniref:hypothetical protein n=1 Tax=Gracilibacillus phocaeensis TaxID=2042304 RepID=UPI00102FC806|nr:hypothetical protein [Gracilibacillus phocaeensis]
MGVQTTVNTEKKSGINTRGWVDKISSKGWVAISLIVAIIFWTILSFIPVTSRSFPNIIVTTESISTMINRGVFWRDIAMYLASKKCMKWHLNLYATCHL